MDDTEHSYRMTLAMLNHNPQIDAIFIVAAGAEGVCRAVVEKGRGKSHSRGGVRYRSRDHQHDALRARPRGDLPAAAASGA